MALAAAPLSGRSYVGPVGQGHGNGTPDAPSGATVRFRVSRNRSSISDFHAPAYNACSGASGVSLPTTAKVHNGGFAIKFSEGLFSVVYKGTFPSSGRASGTIVTKVSNPFGGSCTGTWAWTAKALPATSSICANHTGPPGHFPGASYINIVANHVSCKSVGGTLDSGKFNAKTLAFHTTGWTCAGLNGAYKCKRSTHPASFTFNSDELCGQEGAPRSPQCVVPMAADVALAAGTTVTAVAGGGSHSLAVASTGGVLAWGDNSYGQLGDGATSLSDVPVKVKLPAGTKVTKIAAGTYHSLAVTTTGAVLAWGDNVDGGLGNGHTTRSDVPVKVKLPTGTKVTAVAAGGYHSLAVTSTGAVLAWGDNSYGQLGDGGTKNSHVPVKVKLPVGTKVTAVGTGYGHSVALTSTGAVLAWGYNAFGQLGDGGTKNSDVPVKVKLPTGTKVTAIAAGLDHALALTSTGAVLAWGWNPNGQLGDGGTKNSDVPVKVKLPTGTTVIKIAAGNDHSLALASTGAMLSWGWNLYGQLGNGRSVQSDVPVPVELPAGTKVTKIAAGDFHSLVVTSTGGALAWGYNSRGQLGDGRYGGGANSNVPVQVKLPGG